MTLKFMWDWKSAPEVRTPELAATWSRLRIDLAGITATLVEERDSGHGVRKSIDVPTYPLAEWIAFNWWAILAPVARQEEEAFHVVGAADGFPWPDLTLSSGPGYVYASLSRMDKAPYFVRFLSSVEAVLDANEASFELARFVDATVRRLDDAAISGTALQEEWAAITAARPSEQEFCLAAAAMGVDPYDTSPEERERVLSLAELAGDMPLALDLASSVHPESLPTALTCGWQRRWSVPKLSQGPTLSRTVNHFPLERWCGRGALGLNALGVSGTSSRQLRTNDLRWLIS